MDKAKLSSDDTPVTGDYFKALWMVAIASLFYFYDFFLQVSPSVLTHALKQSLNLHAGSIGLISAAFFITYGPMQLTSGYLSDHWSCRKLLIISMLCCVCGVFKHTVKVGPLPGRLNNYLPFTGSHFLPMTFPLRRFLSQPRCAADNDFFAPVSFLIRVF